MRRTAWRLSASCLLPDWLQTLVFAGLIATTGFLSVIAQSAGLQRDSIHVGESGRYGVGFPIFLGTATDSAARASKLNVELAFGRLATAATIGMLFQDGLTVSAWGDRALYPASPLRAFGCEVAPLLGCLQIDSSSASPGRQSRLRQRPIHLS